ncbi:HAD family hydrolase [Salisediminibacterium halotolerans]|uniref:Hydrolase of the HAD superfamily n=1 Tax=Salisediminibacterium halotolerans TaxID=517425 RepID=A0A1H9WAY5_9BACI|nr:HAD family hydrolase [Salisediminibacterium haloalkalitolerans]SES31102.1 putative hydrolase of the HAD superfamily [Salisediminibacterium haloalkalitolerans]
MTVFFDLDDTLYDQLEPFRKAVADTGFACSGEELYALFRRIRHHSDTMWPLYVNGEISLNEMRIVRAQKAFKDTGMEITEDEAAKLQDSYVFYQAQLSFYPGVENVFHLLQSANIQIGLITNGPGEHQRRKIEALGLSAWIPEELQFISEEIGLTKPDTAVFHYVNEKSGTLPEQSVYVGDNWINDIEPAKHSGWQAVWFNDRHLQQPKSVEPDAVATSFAELYDWLNEQYIPFEPERSAIE